MTTAAFETIRIETTGTVRESSSTCRQTAIVVEASPKGVSVTLAGKKPFRMDGMYPRTAEQAQVMAERIAAHYAGH